MFYEGGLALLPKSFSMTAVQRFLKYSWSRRGGGGVGVLHEGQQMELHWELEIPQWPPAVICHRDRQTEREIERGESAGLSDRQPNPPEGSLHHCLKHADALRGPETDSEDRV